MSIDPKKDKAIVFLCTFRQLGEGLNPPPTLVPGSRGDHRYAPYPRPRHHYGKGHGKGGYGKGW